MPTRIAEGLAGLIGAAITGIGVRFLVAPQVAADGYGVASGQSGEADDPYLAVKGVRDIAAGVVTFALLSSGRPHSVGRYMLAASIIPIGDAAIVLSHDGPKAIAYGVHGSTAAVMLATAALLLNGPE